MNTMTLRASQTPIAYEDQGTGPTVVLLHAFPLDSSMWRAQVADLLPAYRVITLDFPGCGRSAVAAGLTVDSAADVVAELLDHVGVNERVMVGGLSMGGYVALAFARLYPQRLGALILADTRAEPDDEAGRAGREKMIQLVTEHGMPALVEQQLGNLLAPGTKEDRPEVVREVREMAMRQPPEGMVAALKALRDRPDAVPSLAHLTIPVLVIVGEHDAVTSPEKARLLVAAIPNARLVTIPDAGHLSNLENPTAFTAAVREFLDRLRTDQGNVRTV